MISDHIGIEVNMFGLKVNSIWRLNCFGMESNSSSLYQEKPALIFWETTRACLLSCHHCRASSQPSSLPGELSTEQAISMMEQIKNFGKPYPVVIFTGGDPIMRRDLTYLLEYAKYLGITTAVSPAVTHLITDDVLNSLKATGVKSISISVDGASAKTHDGIRGVQGTFERSKKTLKKAREFGLKVQVNTTVMRSNVSELVDIMHFVKMNEVKNWEVIFLVKTGRAKEKEDLTPFEYEGVCNFLYDATSYLGGIRCIEAPLIRRIVVQRKGGEAVLANALYEQMTHRLLQLEGESKQQSLLKPHGLLDGDGIVFVAHDGTIFPGGFVPVPLGNIIEDSLVQVYRNNPLLLRIRNRELRGKCGICDFKYICGGSRARAHAYYGDPLAPDPACLYQVPKTMGSSRTLMY